MRKILSVIAVLTAYFSCFSTVSAYSQEKQNRDTVYVIEIRQNIDNSSMRRLSLGPPCAGSASGSRTLRPRERTT